jgi:outer membrane usher protein
MNLKRTVQSISLLILSMISVLFISSFFITCFTSRPMKEPLAQVQPIAEQVSAIEPGEQGPKIIEVYTPVAELEEEEEVVGGEIPQAATSIGVESSEIDPLPSIKGSYFSSRAISGPSTPKLNPATPAPIRVLPKTIASETPRLSVILPATEPVPSEILSVDSLPEPKQLLEFKPTSPLHESGQQAEPVGEVVEISPPVPDIPVFQAVSSEIMIPTQEPIFFEPAVYSVEDYETFIAPQYSDVPLSEEDDPFADFFVSGEDSTIAFDNGLYYLGLFVNDEYVGDIEANFVDGTQSLNVVELSMFIGDFITDETYERLFSDNLAYISIEELKNRGIETVFDSTDFSVSMSFGVEEMPIRTISVNAGSINRRDAYTLNGSLVLEPAMFSVATSLGFYANVEYDVDFTELSSETFSLSVTHSLAIWHLGFDVYYSLSSSDSIFSFGSWSGFYDFVDTSHRLSFGNVGSNLSDIDSTSYDVNSVGVAFEKNYSYGKDSALGNQFEYSIILVEESTVDIEINGKSVFERTFTAGTYRLKDFVFTQGSNIAKVTITPLARPSDISIQYFDLGYDYRLLGKGDSVYSFSFSVPRVVDSTQVGTISLPWLNDTYLSYFLGNWTATYTQQTGVTNSFTFSSDVSVTPGIFSGTVTGVLASTVGTTQAQLTLGLDTGDEGPSLSGTLNHRFNVPYDSKMGTLSLGLAFSLPSAEIDSSSTVNSYITGNFSYSGSITEKIRFSFSGSITKNSAYDNPSWTTTLSSGFSPFKNFSISGSITVAASADDVWNPSVSGQLSGTYTVTSKLSANTSSSIEFDSWDVVSSYGLAYRPSENDSFSVNLSGVDYQDTADQTLLGTWSHSGDYSSFTFRQQAYDAYSTLSSTLSANTSIAYADGAFGIGQSIGEAFLLVKPVGEMSDAEITVARSLDSSPEYLKRPLGSALYNDITTNTRNSIVVYGSGSSLFGTGTSFVYEINPRSRQAFVAKIDIAATYTISGKLYKPDHTPYVQYSSPVYKVTVGDDGKEVLTPDEMLYLFTDLDGRYIFSDVNPGNYLFDLEVNGLWYGVRFSVPEPEKGKIGKQRVFVLEDLWVSDPKLEHRVIVRDLEGKQVKSTEDVFGSTLATGYDASITLDIERRLDDDTFWSEVFPDFEEIPGTEPEPVASQSVVTAAP